jgi:hypothetical protein
MDFKSKLYLQLKEKKLSDSSIKLYLRNLDKLNDDLPIKNLKFLENVEEILKKLEKYKANTKRGYLISIVSVLSTQLENKKLLKLHKKYYDHMMQINTEIKETPTNEMSRQQSENWLEWSEVEEKYKILRSLVDKFIENKIISEVQYNLLLSLMVLSLYIFNSPRRNKDYSYMHLIRPYKNEIDFNYLDYDNKKFIFNIYKTAKTEGQKIMDISDELYEVINLYLKHHPLLKGKKLPKKVSMPFLVYYDGTEFTADNCITRILNKVFHPKKVSSSMLRHIFITKEFGAENKKMEKVASEMGHTVATQKAYIKDQKII